MGYYSGLIKRKFKDVVGSRYETVQQEYHEFLPTEEELLPREIKKILFPLDISVRGVTDEICDLLGTFEADVSLMYITDAKIYAIIQDALSPQAGEDFRMKKEEYGTSLMDRIETCLKPHGARVHRRMFLGDKIEDVVRATNDYDMIVIPKTYGSHDPASGEVSATSMVLAQSVRLPTVVY